MHNATPEDADRMTVVLKAPEIGTLNLIRQYISVGAPVAIGRGLAVIAAVSEGDLISPNHEAPRANNTAQSMHIDERVKMVGSEPAFLTVVFKLPSLNDAQPLIAQFPYGQKALGTEAVVFGLSTGNLMEDSPCED